MSERLALLKPKPVDEKKMYQCTMVVKHCLLEYGKTIDMNMLDSLDT